MRVRFPHARVLLPRTRLAYVHVGNLLGDAKRDRAARVFGYVAVWLPDELVILFLQEGEVVNATVQDSAGTRPIPIQEALDRIPTGSELGEICFHEADDEQLACMFSSLSSPVEPWPEGLDAADPAALFPYLMSTTFDGLVEINVCGAVNYLIFRDGTVKRAFLSDGSSATLVSRVQVLFDDAAGNGWPDVRRWPVPPALPVQAPHALIQAYRELTAAMVKRLVENGRESAPDIAEHARQSLLDRHPALEALAISDRERPDPVADAETLTDAVAAWITEILWTAADQESVTPEQLLRELAFERRHLFQSVGLFERLPFEVDW
ncbi:MAG: hypothetical protein ACRENI_01970 [Gemmatimonadaceae bacterium]